MLLALAVPVVLAGWTGVQLVRVREAAAAVQDDLGPAKAAVQSLLSAPKTGSPATQTAEAATASDELHARTAQVRAAATRLEDDAHRLGRLTRGLPLSLTTKVPLVGADLRTVQSLGSAADDIGTRVLPVLVDAGLQSVGSPRSGPLDVRPLTSHAEQVRAAARAVQAAAGRARSTTPRTGALHAAQNRVVAELDALDALLRPLSTLATVGAGMTGELGPRRYLVVLQTPAESRATGGLVGGYVDVLVDHGRLQVLRTGSNSDLQNSPTDVVSQPGGFEQTWGSWGAQRSWSASNLSPDFPSVARVWAALYERQTGSAVDGVVGVTPEALVPLLRDVPPVPVPGSPPVTSGDVADLLERGLYARFPAWEQEPLRNAYQQDVLRRLLGAVLSAPARTTQVSAARDAVRSGALRLVSTHLTEQVELQDTTLSGALPRTSWPFVAWTTQNASGDKLDVYLHRSFDYRRVPLGAARQRVTARATVRNDAPLTGLPSYVVGRGQPAGTHEVVVATYLTTGARVESVTVDGVPVTALTSEEAGHPVLVVRLRLTPGGGTATVLVTADEPATSRPVLSAWQPVPTADVRSGDLPPLAPAV